MDAQQYQVPMEMIVLAGRSRTASMNAVSSAREGRFSEAERELDEARALLLESHRNQSDLITQEAQGNPVPLSIVLVHAQDHLVSASLMRDLAGEFVLLYRRLITGETG